MEAEDKSITCLENGKWEPAGCSIKDNVVIACDFEEQDQKNLCQWHSVGKARYSWTRHNGETGTWFTGPDADHSIGDYWGHYVYLEANAPAEHQDVAQFVLPSFTGNQEYCFQFWYHMYGSQIVYMSVYLQDLTTKVTTEMTRILGNQRNSWHQATFNITSDVVQNDFSIGIESERGLGTKGDYAIDDLIVTKGLCKGSQEH
ncbi:MAM and LDL-receptor class A domain-containing protein 1-like [Mercenaria mercenaria]|uniref:MAM and LDL-receptor class A domain-containing protein 1-like n=1 Tax=Mercenaria mercenaria TaxID=6596 RepID=UPI00234F05A8|nr:MAM and LDL-receptor class A domain-containing protein 1-like [Mercenaria mercenaria]